MGEFYQCVVTRPTVEWYDVRAFAKELAESDNVRDLLDELLYATVRSVLLNKGVRFSQQDGFSYDEEEDINNRLYEAIDGEMLQRFLEKHSKLQPYFATDDNDERNRAIVREHVARAKELVKDIKRIS